MAKRRKKKNYRLRKSVRRTLGALFMMSAIIVAAIPFPDAAATSGAVPLGTGSAADVYAYTEDSSKNTEIGNDLVCETSTTKYQALYVRKNSDGSYTLLNQFDFFEKTFDGSTFGVISKYYDTYATGTVNLSSNVSKKYYTVTVDDFNNFYSSGMGSQEITLDLDSEDSVALWQTYFLSRYNEHLTELENYKTLHKAWEDGGKVGQEPVKPQAPKAVPNTLTLEQKRSYYCYQNQDLAGKGYTLEYVINKAGSGSGGSSTNEYIYIAKGGTPPSNMKNDEEGFLVETTASIIAIGSSKDASGNERGAFYQVQNVDKLTLPSEIKYIGDHAFENCFIKTVDLTGVQEIGDYAFKDSGELANVTMSDQSVSKIGHEAFYGCTALTSVIFPSPLSVIKDGAFAECTNLSTVDFTKVKNSGGTIGNGAFYNTSLGNLSLGETGITTLGNGVFSTKNPSKDRLVTVDMEHSRITTMGESLFSGRQVLTKVTMPAEYGVNSEVTLAENTFTGCSNLGKLIFPTYCGYITYGPNIFRSVLNNTFVVQGPAKTPSGEVAKERLATRNCTNGVSTTDEQGNTEYGPVPYVYQEGNEYFYEVKSGDYLLSLRVNDSDLTATVTSCDFLDRTQTPTQGELKIPSNVGPYKVIGLEEGCFSDSVKDSLNKVVIKDNSLVHIGNSVFEGCTNIKTVEIGNSVVDIGTNAFKDCTSLTKVTIGEKVTSIGAGAFEGCNKLEDITFVAPIGGGSSFPVENIGSKALSTGSNKLTVTGIIEEGYGPFEWAMDSTNYVDASLGIRVCYKTPSPSALTVILDNQNNLPTLVDYPHYGDLSEISISVNSTDPSGNVTTVTKTLKEQYESGGELRPSEEALVNATLEIDIPAGIESIDVKGYLNDSSKTYDGVEAKTNGYNVSAYFTNLKYKDTYKQYGLFGGESNDADTEITPVVKDTRGNDRVKRITMHTVKYLPNSNTISDISKPGDDELQSGAFYSCENLETVDLGSAMEDVGILPFLGCYNLSSVGSSSPKYTCNKKILYENLDSGKLSIVQVLGSRGNANDGYVNVDNDENFVNVSDISVGAFSDIPTLRGVDFRGNSLITKIPAKCFYDDENLSQVILSPEIGVVGWKSMAKCSKNATLTIYGREVALAETAFDDTVGGVIYAYEGTAAYKSANEMPNVEVRKLDKTFEVQFYDYDGITALTDVQYIEEGKNAQPPEEDPVRQGYIFSGWNKSYKNITEDTDILALYDYDENSNGSGSGSGSGSGGNGSGSGNGGTNVGGGIDTDGDGIPDVDANGNKVYKLTVTNGEGSGYYAAGKTISISAGAAPSGSTFAYWSCSNSSLIFNDSTKASTTLTMVASDVTVIANYAGQYTLEVEYGSGSGSYPAGTKVAISAVAAPQGRRFASWVSKTSGLSIESSTKESTVITMPASNAKVTATYADTGSISSNSTSNKPSQNGTSVMITKPGISDKDKASAYVSGSSDNFVVKISESAVAADEVQKALQKKYPDMTRIKYFAMDISLYDAKGENKITDTTGLKVNITIPIPDALKEYAGNNKVGAVVNGELETLNPKFTTIDGVPSISFTATHFSPYTIYVDTGNLTVSDTLDATPKTGDGIHPKWFLSLGLACISIILFTKKDRRYVVRA